MKQTYKVTIWDVKFGKKTTIAIEIKGNMSDEQKLALMAFAHSDGFIQIASAQQDITDYEPKNEHVGIAYKLDGGEIKIDPNQLDMDDVVGGPTGEPSEEEKEIESMRSEAEDEQEKQPSQPVVAVQVLKGFKYQEKTRKKNEIIQMPQDIALGLVESKVVQIIESEELPF